jgi:regulatory protein
LTLCAMHYARTLFTMPTSELLTVELSEKDLKRAKNTAYRYLTIRSRSKVEILKKLRDKEFSEPVIETVMEHLLRLGYVDDRKFACQWATSRARIREYGRHRIEQELRQKGVAKETIREALVETIPPEDERETARTVAEKKLMTMKSLEPEARKRRLAGFLERKGFPHEIIWDILRTVR